MTKPEIVAVQRAALTWLQTNVFRAEGCDRHARGGIQEVLNNMAGGVTETPCVEIPAPIVAEELRSAALEEAALRCEQSASAFRSMKSAQDGTPDQDAETAEEMAYCCLLQARWIRELKAVRTEAPRRPDVPTILEAYRDGLDRAAKVCDGIDAFFAAQAIREYIDSLDPSSLPAIVTDAMVDRFLSWKLPEDFRPDAGINFKREYNEGTPYPGKHQPVGTNLLNADQARKMLEHVLACAVSPQATQSEPK